MPGLLTRPQRPVRIVDYESPIVGDMLAITSCLEVGALGVGNTFAMYVLSHIHAATAAQCSAMICATAQTVTHVLQGLLVHNVTMMVVVGFAPVEQCYLCFGCILFYNNKWCQDWFLAFLKKICVSHVASLSSVLLILIKMASAIACI